ncbi:MAG: hypothetical protein AAGC58_04315 [Asticcacaulis sp.]
MPEYGWYQRWLIKILPWALMSLAGLLWARWYQEINAWLDKGLNNLWLMVVLAIMLSTQWMSVAARRLVLLAMIWGVCAGLAYVSGHNGDTGGALLSRFPYSVYLMALTISVCLFLKPRSRHFDFVLAGGSYGALFLELVSFSFFFSMSELISVLRFLFIERPLTTFVVFFLPLLFGAWAVHRFISHRRGGF